MTTTPPPYTLTAQSWLAKVGRWMLVGMALVLTAGSCLAQTTFYVQPGATGTQVGTLANPFATIAQAQTAVQGVNSSMTGNITVYLMGGTYNLTSGLTFGTADSGTNGYNVIYTNYNSQVPIISGGSQYPARAGRSTTARSISGRPMYQDWA